MFMVDLLQWWYIRGWSIFSHGVSTKISNIADTFSIGELMRTLFKPYRQIGTTAAVNESKLNQFVDRLISSIVGATSRLVLIIAGIIAIVLTAVLGAIMIVIWPLIPVVPLMGIILAVMGVVL